MLTKNNLARNWKQILKPQWPAGENRLRGPSMLPISGLHYEQMLIWIHLQGWHTVDHCQTGLLWHKDGTNPQLPIWLNTLTTRLTRTSLKIVNVTLKITLKCPLLSQPGSWFCLWQQTQRQNLEQSARRRKDAFWLKLVRMWSRVTPLHSRGAHVRLKWQSGRSVGASWQLEAGEARWLQTGSLLRQVGSGLRTNERTPCPDFTKTNAPPWRRGSRGFTRKAISQFSRYEPDGRTAITFPTLST